MVNNELVCHTGIIQFPMRKGWKRVHRLVVLPDYQGIGIGMKFINAVARMVEPRARVNLTTTTPSIVHALAKSDEWNMVRQGRSKTGFAKSSVHAQYKGIGHLDNAASDDRVTYSFNHKEVNSIGTG